MLKSDLVRIRRPFPRDPVAATRCALPHVYKDRIDALWWNVAVRHGHWGLSSVRASHWMPDRDALLQHQFELRNLNPGSGPPIMFGLQLAVLLHPNVDAFELQRAEQGDYLQCVDYRLGLETVGYFIADALTWNPEAQQLTLHGIGGPAIWWWLPYAHWAPAHAKAAALRLRMLTTNRDEVELGRLLPDHAAGAVRLLLHEDRARDLARGFVASRRYTAHRRFFRDIDEPTPSITPAMIADELYRATTHGATQARPTLRS